MTRRAALILSLALAPVLNAAAPPHYAIVSSEATAADPQWKPVIEALGSKYAGAARVVYPAGDVGAALGKLKEIHPDLPIVIITGYPDSEILSKILSGGPVTVIKKPIEFEQLNRTVKILGHKGTADVASPKG